jgi:hypothetical protein
VVLEEDESNIIGLTIRVRSAFLAVAMGNLQFGTKHPLW